MKKIITKPTLLASLCLAGSVLFGMSSHVYAKGTSFSIYPANFQIRATLPADIRAPFTITNKSNNALDLKIIVKRIKQSTKENGQFLYEKPALLDERPEDSFLKNVFILDDGFALSTLTLAPQQEKKLHLAITTDKSLPPKDEYFSLVFLTVPHTTPSTASTEKETKTYIQSGTNLPVLVSLASDQEQVGFIDEFSSPFFLQSGPVPFTVKIKNAGTHFISPQGVILVKNLFGQTVGEVELPPTSILAGTSRYLIDSKVIAATLNEKEKAKFGTSPKAFWSEKFLVGFYTATLSVTMGNNDTLYTRSVPFVAFPFSAMLILFGLIYASFILIKRVKKKVDSE